MNFLRILVAGFVLSLLATTTTATPFLYNPGDTGNFLSREVMEAARAPLVVTTNTKASLFERINLKQSMRKEDPYSFSKIHLSCGKYGLLVPLRSQHFSPQNDFNQDNLGIGLRYYPCGKDFENIYVGITYVGRNSLRGKTLVTGIGTEYNILRVGGTQVKFGLEANYLNYEVPTMCRGQLCRHEFVVTGALPMPTLTFQNISSGLFFSIHRLVPNKKYLLFSTGLNF